MNHRTTSRTKPTPLFPDAVARDPLDFDRTPTWCVELLLPHISSCETILDAGCGDGAIGRVLRVALPEARIYGVEKDRARYAAAGNVGCYSEVLLADWLTKWPSSTGPHQLIISNPPFNAALEFLRAAIYRVAPGGTVAFLLPTHWDHDPDVKTEFARQRFLDGLRLPDGREGYCKLRIVGGGKNPGRPAFRGGGTATDRYAWFMFGVPWAGQPSRRIHAIPPVEESMQMELI
jgi:hypothetical protein